MSSTSAGKRVRFYVRRLTLRFTTLIVALAVMILLPVSAASALPMQNDGPDDPTQYLPGGPDFALFSGFAPLTRLVLGAVLFVIFVVGVCLLIAGAVKFRAANRETGRGAQGVGLMISGLIVIVSAFALIPLLTLVLGVAQDFGANI